MGRTGLTTVFVKGSKQRGKGKDIPYLSISFPLASLLPNTRVWPRLEMCAVNLSMSSCSQHLHVTLIIVLFMW